MSRDWISNEIFRRVEPNGKTMGEVLREIRAQYKIDIVLGVREDELHLIHPWKLDSTWKTIKDLWRGPEKAPTVGKLKEVLTDFRKLTN